MPKIPDFSKFDLQGIINSVKSMISSEPTTLKTAEGDLGKKMQEVNQLLKTLADNQAQQIKDINKLNNLIIALYSDIESRTAEAEKTSASESTKSSVETEQEETPDKKEE